MMPDRAVCSPTAVTRTRRLPPLATVPAMTAAPGSLDTVRDSPVITDSSTSAAPSTTVPSAATRVPGLTKTKSPTRNAESGTISISAPLIRSTMSGSSAARALSAPWAWEIALIWSQCPRSIIVIKVATSHQTSILRRSNVPASDVKKATVIPQLMRVIMPGLRSASSFRAPTDENQAAIEEDDRSKDRRNPVRSREGAGCVSKPMLDVARPQDNGNRESEAQPKLVAKHGDGVSRVMVVTCGGSRHIMDDVRINRLVIVVRYVVHFEILESAP